MTTRRVRRRLFAWGSFALFAAGGCSGGTDTKSTSGTGGVAGFAGWVGTGTGGISAPSGSGGTLASGGVPSTGGALASGGTVSGGAGGSGGTAIAADGGGIDPADAGDASLESGQDGGSAGDADASTAGYSDPGTGAWTVVPADQVRAACRLDPDALAAAAKSFDFPFAVVRYGRLCYEHKALAYTAQEAWSTTKTLGAFVAGAVAYETKDIPRTGRKTGPFTDDDRVDQWLDTFAYNKDAHVAHVLAMVANNADLSLGKKTMTYDTIGVDQINTLSDMLNAAVAQDSARLGPDLEAFTQKFVFAPLGMTHSTWSGGAATKTFAYTWSTDVLDQARLGLAILHRGWYGGRRIVSEEWVYRMTHPAFEDANTGYGYLTWLNASSNFTFGGIPTAAPPPPAGGKYQGAYSPGPCAPVSVFSAHPHGLSDSPDCNYVAPYACDQPLDVGVWQAEGLGGQVIQGHPGLDLLLVVRDQGGLGPDTPKPLWDALRPAVVAADPKYQGDEKAFCADYGANRYAPDLR